MDPAGVLNPNRLVRPPKMDDRQLFRYPPGYAVAELETVFAWSAYSGAGGGFQGAVEMCNNNGACRKAEGVMCPSYRVTGDERDLTRGRANSLRLAISGQLGPDALTADAMMETLSLCVSCKGCRRECPTGVDMAKMKIEVLAARARKQGVALRELLIAYLPRYAPYAAKAAGAMNLRDRVPGLAKLSERLLGFAADRKLPQWRRDVYRQQDLPMQGEEVLLFADTFNRYFEPDNLRDAETVLRRAGFAAVEARPPVGEAGGSGSKGRPLCCGRTFLAAGLVEEAKAEMRRTLAVIGPAVARGVPVVGLEPSCLLTFRDEMPALLGDEWTPDQARQVMLFEEFIAARLDPEGGGFELPLAPLKQKSALLHGHCHQKAFDAVAPVQEVLGLVPELQVELVNSSCCGMAGSFGYQAETAAISRRMGELSLLPRVRSAGAECLVIADGTSCRHQIIEGAAREAVHVARVLRESSDLALN
jgi:Fe-S oxidoreductase